MGHLKISNLECSNLLIFKWQYGLLDQQTHFYVLCFPIYLIVSFVIILQGFQQDFLDHQFQLLQQFFSINSKPKFLCAIFNSISCNRIIRKLPPNSIDVINSSPDWSWFLVAPKYGKLRSILRTEYFSLVCRVIRKIMFYSSTEKKRGSREDENGKNY